MVLAYIPFTQARRQRLMKESWQAFAAGYDGLAMVEWPDGSKSPKPVNWDDELNALTTEDGKTFFVRGRAAEPRQLFGIPVWDVNAEGLGIVSTEAALISDREHFDEYEEATVEDAPQLATNGEAVADGGEPVSGAVYNLNPPRGYDGEGFSVSLPADYAPFPASQTDAEQAVTQAEQAQNDESANLTWLLIGAGMALGSVLLFLIVQFAMNEIGGGGGGGGQTLEGLAPLLLVGTAPLREELRGLWESATEVTN